ncbi:MAG: UDP-N-acetylmuramoyl-L-alanine--D-glutamate ligase [Burkholderiales bacterium]
MNPKGKTVLVLGLGISGMSMVRWLTNRGAVVRAADTRTTPPCLGQVRTEFPGVDVQLGALEESTFTGADVVAISPGVPLAEPLVRRAREQGVPVVGDVELFAQMRKEYPHSKVIAVTGSNGKSTVTEMVGAMCKSAGVRTQVAGNIGLPVLDVLSDIDAGKCRVPDLFVLELSSFQLETTATLNAEAAVVLNLSEDHLDRYDSVGNYAEAKSRIFEGDGVQVLNRQDELTRHMAVGGRCVFTFGTDEPNNAHEWGLRKVDGDLWLAQGQDNLIKASELQVAGLHNLANALAALALCRGIRLPYPRLLQGLREFAGLPHRVQKIAEFDGIRFYDDSKGTNVGATAAALEGLDGHSVVILGGEGKNQDFTPLVPAIARKARAVLLIGRDADLIERAIARAGVRTERAVSMHEAVARARELAQPGDAVLLSPACASFDMFRDYRHRADVFAAAVAELERSK